VWEGYAADNVNWFVTNNRIWLQVGLAVRDSDGAFIGCRTSVRLPKHETA
jgi:hypothetical protein